MANEEDSAIQQEEREEQEDANQEQEDQDEVDEDDLKWSSSSSSNSDSDYGSDYDSYSDYDYTPEDQQQGKQEGDPLLSNIRRGRGPQGTRDNTPEANFRRYSQVLDSRSVREWQEEEDEEYEYYEDLYDFPKDPENWREEDLKELWADAPVGMTKPGWDPVWADEEDWEVVNEEIREGRDPPIAPFYIPYRKPYPVIPDNHYDISNPKAVIEELDRIEEFLKWVSYIFPDGSSYEGTVWDDLAHGKGVYVGEMGLVRYEGEWLRNDMEGHGVVEVDIPEMEPLPGSKLEKKMRAEGHIFSRDFLPPEDKEWLEMDIEDSVQVAGGDYEIPFYERETWIKEFGRKPEKGRYRYAGQWKHGRMHGCGIYEVNERPVHGRFYFGELLQEDDYGCNEEISTLHAGIAEVAAAKARMFVNKPDGMVREANGPYSDPQHPYFYEEDDVWMAPGFINQFYEVPDYWKTYVHDVDQEREMWLNSFYKAPLRLPMPAELEHWWSKDEEPEFVLINKEPEPDPEDPSKLVYAEDPLILHTPTGWIINYVDDEKHGIRLFWQPPLKDGEEPDPEKVQFLPLGFDEFYGRDTAEKKESMWKRLIMAIENACKPVFDKIDKWTEEKRKDSKMKIKLYEKELELIEAELCLEEAIEEMDEELKMEEEEEAAEMDSPEEEDISLSTKEDISASTNDDISTSAKEDEKSFPRDEDDDEEEEEEDFSEPSNFGSVSTDQDPEKNEQNGNKPRDSPFSALSLSFASCSLVVSSVPSMLRKPVSLWRKHECPTRPIPLSDVEGFSGTLNAFDSVSFPRELGVKGHLRAKWPANLKSCARKHSSEAISPLWSQSRLLLRPSASVSHKSSPKVSRTLNSTFQHAAPRTILDNILSLHVPLNGMEPSQHEIVCEPSLVFSEVK